MSNKKETNLIGVNTNYLQTGDDVYRKHTQNISQAFLDDLKESRNSSKDKNEGEFMKVASIPVIVVEKWMREGFNIYEASGQEIVNRLKKENLDYFMATEKRI